MSPANESYSLSCRPALAPLIRAPVLVDTLAVVVGIFVPLLLACERPHASVPLVVAAAHGNLASNRRPHLGDGGLGIVGAVEHGNATRVHAACRSQQRRWGPELEVRPTHRRLEFVLGLEDPGTRECMETCSGPRIYDKRLPLPRPQSIDPVEDGRQMRSCSAAEETRLGLERTLEPTPFLAPSIIADFFLLLIAIARELSLFTHGRAIEIAMFLLQD